MLVSVMAIFLSTSESSKLAVAASIAVFLFANALGSKGHYKIYYFLVMSVVLGPALWVCLAPIKPFLGQVLPEIEAVTIRVALFDYTASLIQKELVLGYGFGSTLFMPIPKGTIPWPFFPGGHTHNLVLQFFIDHGLLGLVFITAVLSLFFYYLYHALKDNPQAPAIWALLFSGLVLFSLSYAIWNADVVLMYCMWLALIFSVSSRGGRPVADWLSTTRSSVCCILFGITAFVCYAVDFLFLAGK